MDSRMEMEDGDGHVCHAARAANGDAEKLVLFRYAILKLM